MTLELAHQLALTKLVELLQTLTDPAEIRRVATAILRVKPPKDPQPPVPLHRGDQPAQHSTQSPTAARAVPSDPPSSSPAQPLFPDNIPDEQVELFRSVFIKRQPDRADEFRAMTPTSSAPTSAPSPPPPAPTSPSTHPRPTTTTDAPSQIWPFAICPLAISLLPQNQGGFFSRPILTTRTMADVLDQSEIDALLAAVDSGEVEEEQNALQIFSRHRRDLENVEVRPYDFKRPERVSKDQMRSLQTLHEAFARNFGAALSGFLRTIVEVKVANCEQMTYAEFISGLPNPTSFNLMEAKPLEGQMCLEISPLIIYPIIDRLLGGTNSELFIPQRPMTLIETRLIGKVTTRGLQALSEAWASVKPLNFEITATESNPQLVQIVPPNEVVVVIGFELKMANRAGTMNLCIPYNVIEPIIDALSSQSWFNVPKTGRGAEVKNRIAGTLNRAGLTVTGLLAETTITLRDLMNLSIGDVITTERPASTPVVLCVENEKSFLGHIGQFKGSRAIKVLRAVNTNDRV